MGQYYKPICLDSRKRTVKGWLFSHKFDNGLKLMEHSWIGNSFMEAVESLLIPGGAWYKKPIVWAGDYADKEKGSKTNLYSRCKETNEVIPLSRVGKTYKYIVNHTQKMYVDKTKVPVSSVYDKFEFKIHPLSLLTCEGNGRGGGDYHGKEEIVGSWARNIISVEKDIPKGYTELPFTLKD